jgi:hypothetical protein
LPCCYKGTIPTIDQLDVLWPSDAVIATLQADTRLPNKQLTSKQLVSAQLAPVQLAAVQFGHTYAKTGLKIGMIALVPEMQWVPVSLSPAQSRNIYLAKKNLKLGIIASLPEVQWVPLTNGSSNANGTIPPILEPLSCRDNSCDGYDCIYTYDGESAGGVTGETAAGAARVAIRRGDIRNVNITVDVFEVNASISAVFGVGGVGKSKPAKEEIYKITVGNGGDVPLNDVKVSAVMPEGMKFINTVYFDSTRGELTVERDPIEFDEQKKTTLTWNIGDLQPDEIKSILLKAHLKQQVDNTKINAKVTGSAPGSAVVRSSADRAVPALCSPKNDGGQPCSEVHIAAGLCKKVCPDWSKRML